MTSIREADLYPPLKQWLEDSGYTVRAEVNTCDVAAEKDGALILIEMKRAVNLDLLLQLMRRQQADAAVYAAVPAPTRHNARWRELNRLLKRLETGLLLVHLDSALPRVEVAFHPLPQSRLRHKHATRSLLTEMSGRSMDLNVGGTHRRKLVTAYREQALHVAAALEKIGPCAPTDLRRIGTSEKTGAILLANHYGWFEHLAPASYALTQAGREGLAEFPELVAKLREKLTVDNAP